MKRFAILLMFLFLITGCSEKNDKVNYDKTSKATTKEVNIKKEESITTTSEALTTTSTKATEESITKNSTTKVTSSSKATTKKKTTTSKKTSTSGKTTTKASASADCKTWHFSKEHPNAVLWYDFGDDGISTMDGDFMNKFSEANRLMTNIAYDVLKEFPYDHVNSEGMANVAWCDNGYLARGIYIPLWIHLNPQKDIGQGYIQSNGKIKWLYKNPSSKPADCTIYIDENGYAKCKEDV